MSNDKTQLAADAAPIDQKLLDFLQDKMHDVTTEAMRNVACIVSFSSSKFGDEVKDDFLAAELAKAHGTDSNNLSVTKSIFGDRQFPELSSQLPVQHVGSWPARHARAPWPARAQHSPDWHFAPKQQSPSLAQDVSGAPNRSRQHSLL